MNRLQRYSGFILFALGCLHTLVASIESISMSLLTLKGNTYSDAEKELSFWFYICGMFIMLSGVMVQHYIDTTKKSAPTFIAISLIVLGIIGVTTIPVSGFWLLLILGILMACKE